MMVPIILNLLVSPNPIHSPSLSNCRSWDTATGHALVCFYSWERPSESESSVDFLQLLHYPVNGEAVPDRFLRGRCDTHAEFAIEQQPAHQPLECHGIAGRE